MAKLFVIGLTTPDPEVRSELDAIAAAGGSGVASYVSGLTELNAALDYALMQIVRATSP
jgi:hypothetical protein